MQLRHLGTKNKTGEGRDDDQNIIQKTQNGPRPTANDAGGRRMAGLKPEAGRSDPRRGALESRLSAAPEGEHFSVKN